MTPFINSTSNSSGWTTMRNQKDTFEFSDWLDFLLVNGLTLVVIGLIFLSGGCGTGVGNPEGMPLGESVSIGSQSQAIVDQYNANSSPSEPNGVECGSFTGESALNDVETGHQCIRDAFVACHPARYLLNQTLPDDTQFVSYVAVEPTSSFPLACQLRVHTLSSDVSSFIGEDEKTCTTLSESEPIELACGIGM